MISSKEIYIFEERINFRFNNKENLINSLIHPSYIMDKSKYDKKFQSNFERNEFLGDRVLSLIIAGILFNKFKNQNEGDLTKKLSFFFQKYFLYKIANEINISSILKYSFNKNHSRMATAILADSVESLIGGIFVDSGYEKTFKFVENIWRPYLNVNLSEIQDPKTHLQELSQEKFNKLPQYELVKKDGPPHSPSFTVKLNVFNLESIEGIGKSIQEAEKNAAKLCLDLLNEK